MQIVVFFLNTCIRLRGTETLKKKRCGTNQKCKSKELFFSAAAKDGNQEPRSSIPWNFLVRLPVDPDYWFYLSVCYNHLISVHVLEEENSSTVYSVDMDFTFIAQKDESAIVKRW